MMPASTFATKNALSRSVLTAMMLFWMVKPVAAQDPSQATIKVTPVTTGIYMLEGPGGNIGMSVGDHVFLIDDQIAPMTAKVKAAIATVSSKPVRFILNTHWRFDHTGGNEALAGDGSIIVAHDNPGMLAAMDRVLTHSDARTKIMPGHGPLATRDEVWGTGFMKPEQFVTILYQDAVNARARRRAR